MVHRSVLGSVERAVAHLIERHGGAFPVWLAPVQLVVLPVSRAQEDAARELVRRAAAAGLRAELSPADQGTLGARVRAARLVPYQAVIGAREAEADQASLRLRDGRRRARCRPPHCSPGRRTARRRGGSPCGTGTREPSGRHEPLGRAAGSAGGGRPRRLRSEVS